MRSWGLEKDAVGSLNRCSSGVRSSQDTTNPQLRKHIVIRSLSLAVLKPQKNNKMKQITKKYKDWLENRAHLEEHLVSKICHENCFTTTMKTNIVQLVVNDILDIMYHPAPKSIPGMLQHDSVTGVNQEGNPERLDSFQHPFLDVLKKSRHYIVDRYLYLSMRAEDFHQIVNEFDKKYFVIPKFDSDTPHTGQSNGS